MRIEYSLWMRAPIILVTLVLGTGVSGNAGRAHVSAGARGPQKPSGEPPLPSMQADQSAELEVLVVDPNHKPVADMKPEDFRLTQENQDLKIDSARLNASPRLNLAILFDFSGSRHGDPNLQQEFAETDDFLRRIWQAGDEATVAAFNDNLHTVISRTQNLDAAVQAVDSLSRLGPRGGTALYDTICSVATDRNPASDLRNVALIFSDFDDDSSHKTAEQGIECALRGKVSIYSFVILQKSLGGSERRHDLKIASDLSEKSGGVTFNAGSTVDFVESLSQLSQFLDYTYEITFTPRPAKSSREPVRVDLETTRPGVKLYFARSYYPQ